MNVNIDILNLEVDQQGIKNYFFPFSPNDLLDAENFLYSHFSKIAKYQKQEKMHEKEIFSIIMILLIEEVMTSFRCLKFLDGFQKCNHQLLIPDRYKNLKHFMENKTPDIQQNIAQLHRGPDRAKFYTAPILKAREFFKWNKLSIDLLNPKKTHDLILSVHNIPLIETHAKQSPAIVKYSLMAEWYNETPVFTKRISPQWTEIIEAVLEVVIQLFHKHQIQLPQTIQSYLKKLMDELYIIVNSWTESILKNASKFPDTLWTGTGAKIWTRMLRHAVRHAGNTVEGHDHGHCIGISLIPNRIPPSFHIAEFDSCDTFWTVNDSYAKQTENNLQHQYVSQDQLPQIRSLQLDLIHKSGKQNPSLFNRNITKWMLPTSVYTEDMTLFNFPGDGYIMIDFHARILSNLSKLGYHTIHKPHPPEICINPDPNLFGNAYQTKTLTCPLQQSLQECDGIVFDYIQTTILPNILASQKPIVFFDLGFINWLPEFKALFLERCVIMDAWFDEENRAQIHWDQLDNALNQAVELCYAWYNDPEKSTLFFGIDQN